MPKIDLLIYIIQTRETNFNLFRTSGHGRSSEHVGTLGTRNSFARQQVRPQAQRQSLKLWMAARKARGSYHLPFDKRFFIILFLRSFQSFPQFPSVSAITFLIRCAVCQVRTECISGQVTASPSVQEAENVSRNSKIVGEWPVPTSNIIQPVSFMDFQQNNDGACSEYDILQSTSITW